MRAITRTTHTHTLFFHTHAQSHTLTHTHSLSDVSDPWGFHHSSSPSTPVSGSFSPLGILQLSSAISPEHPHSSYPWCIRECRKLQFLRPTFDSLHLSFLIFQDLMAKVRAMLATSKTFQSSNS